MDMEQEFRRLNEAIAKITERLGGTDLPMVLTRERAAKELSVSVSTLKKLIREGKVFTVEIGRRRMVPSAEVLRLATPPPAEFPASERKRRARKEQAQLRAVTGDAAAEAVLAALKRRKT